MKNKKWWNKNPMNYNWDEKKKSIRLIKLQDIKKIDNIFFDISKEFAHPN